VTRPFCSRDFPFCSLCPFSSAELNAPIYLKKLERAKGIEPSTYSLGSCRSTTELRPQRRRFPTFDCRRSDKNRNVCSAVPSRRRDLKFDPFHEAAVARRLALAVSSETTKPRDFRRARGFANGSAEGELDDHRDA
jgi:hypothetical protein